MEAHAAPPFAPRSAWSRLVEVASLVATPLRPSHYVELVRPLWATHKLSARIEELRDETRDARTLTLRPGRAWRTHRAGQFVRVGVEIDGMRHVRTYSISSAPDPNDERIAITVKAMPGGRVSTHLVRNLTPGAYLTLGLPEGEFVLPEAVPVRPLFITAGSGVTPVMSMLRSAARRGRMPDAVHVHYAPEPREVIFRDELARIATEHSPYRLRSVYTRTPDGTTGSEHFSARQIDALCPDWREREAWACGPQALLDAVEAHWRGAGLERRLHVERFHAARAVLPIGAAGGTVRFAASGRAIEADGSTPLLRAAEDAGLNPPHGCRMGICHSCDATLVSGCVRDLRTGALLEGPGRKVQLCITAAAGDVGVELGSLPDVETQMRRSTAR